jgi:hypothetical protein
MGALVSIYFVVIAAVALTCVWFAWWVLWSSLRPVDRPEVELFARSANLTVSVENGVRIIDAIARTRFWRVIGATAAVVLAVLFLIWNTFRTQKLDINLWLLLVFLAGYYVGSVVAEYRTAHQEYGEVPRVASLRPRQLSDYIGSWAKSWPRALAVSGLAAALVAVIAANRLGWGAVAGVGAALIAVTTAVVGRHIVERPSTVESAELMAADSAIRSRSLHALFGATVGIQMWLACIALIEALAAVATRAGWRPHGPLWFAVLLILGAIVPIRGVFIARNFIFRPFEVRVLDAVAP